MPESSGDDDAFAGRVLSSSPAVAARGECAPWEGAGYRIRHPILSPTGAFDGPNAWMNLPNLQSYQKLDMAGQARMPQASLREMQSGTASDNFRVELEMRACPVV